MDGGEGVKTIYNGSCGETGSGDQERRPRETEDIMMYNCLLFCVPRAYFTLFCCGRGWQQVYRSHMQTGFRIWSKSGGSIWIAAPLEICHNNHITRAYAVLCGGGSEF